MSDQAPAWAVPLIAGLGRVEGKLDALNSQFAAHVVDDKVVAAEVALVKTQVAATAAATGAKAKIVGAITHMLTGSLAAAATIFAKKHGI
jgi:hypothetical protein